MKHPLSFCLLLISGAAMAQQDSRVMPYNKKYLDSVMGEAYRKHQPFIMQVPEGGKDLNTVYLTTPKTFEELNAGATVINKTSRGTIYNMPLDNMAVLVPDMKKVERMPGSSQVFKVAPRSNMPNPLYPSKPRSGSGSNTR